MENASIGVLIAFGAGVLSFLSPCVLPLIPSYLSFITGFSLEEMGQKKHTALLHSALFVSGFTMIFMALGAGATAVGRLLNTHQIWLERAGGLLIIVFGLYLMGAFRWAFLDKERRMHLQDKPVGYLGSVLVGMAFGAGWTPCIGPALAAILALTMQEADLTRGLGLLFAYSMGLAVPFLLAALGVERFMGWFQKYRQYMPIVTKVSGAMLVSIGVLMITGYFSLMATWLQGFTPEFIRSRL